MDNDPKVDDLLRLNALVDGELPPAEHAEIAARLAVDQDLARAYVTLAQLKATVGVTVSAAPAFALQPQRRSRMSHAVAACLVALAVLAQLGLLAANWMSEHGAASAVAEGPTAITLASLPAATNIPRLDTAGLKLIGLAIDPGQVPLFTAAYRGPHGCRLDLRAWPEGTEAPALAGSSRYTWNAGGLVYELVAHGMPRWRFAIIAEAAEQQTRHGSDHNRIDRRLRAANSGAPPCVS